MSAPLIAPSASAKHGVTRRTASTPNFVVNLRRSERGDGDSGRDTENHGMRGRATAPTRSPAAARVDVASTLEAVEHKPRQKADGERDRDGRGRHAHDRRRRPSRLGQKHRADDRRAAHDRADRQIDAAEQDDNGHSGRDEAGDRHLPQHVGEILGRREDVRCPRTCAAKEPRRSGR